MKTSPFRPLLPLLLLPAALHAEIIGVETFDYPDGPLAGQSGGIFWDFKNTSPTSHTGAASGWDDVIGAPGITLSRLVTDDSAIKREYNGASEAEGAVNGVNVNKAVYYRVTLTTGDTLPQFFGLSSLDFGDEKLFFGKRFLQPNFGIEESGGATVDSGPAITANTSYTLVAKLDFENDVVALFINPDLNQPEPAATASQTYTGTNWSTAVRLASGSGGEITWDKLVVATTWDDLGTVVTNTADSGAGSLRDAIANAPDGGLITFAPSLDGETITLTSGQLNLSRNAAIDASGLPRGIRISGNRASRVMGISSENVRLNHLTIADGFTDSFGGGINTEGALSMVDCSITDNTAVSVGGGVNSLLGGGIDTLRCTFSGNTGAEGGAIRHEDAGAVTLRHCTLSGNRATSEGGGGALTVVNGTTTLIHCTVTDNQAPAQAGGLFLQSPATLALENCIIAGNQAPLGADILKVSGTLTPTGANLIGSNQDVETEFPAGPLVGTPASPLDPKLSPLAYYGGRTMTRHPLVGSPAIDAAGTTDPGGSDQRGYDRFSNGDAEGITALDIGAVEAGLKIFATTLVDEDNGNFFFAIGTGASLREAIKYAPDGAVITFDTVTGFEDTPVVLSLGEILIDKNLFIDASNLDAPVTISGNHTSRVFRITGAAEVAMTHLAITDGRSDEGLDWDDPSNPDSPLIGTPGAPGGGILNNGDLSLIHCHIHGNETGMGGDGFFDPSSDVPGGKPGTGGGIHNQGRLLLESSTLSGNRTGALALEGVSARGGGIYSDTGSALIIRRSSLIDNIADRGSISGDGGAIYLHTATLRAHDSTFSGNRGFAGGAIRCAFSSEASLSRCTLAGNTARDGGGAIEMNSGTHLFLDHCTISANSAGLSGGGAIINDGNTTANHSILAGNTPDNIAQNPVTGTGNLLSGDPLLSPPGDFGGPTPSMLPLPGSPAIDAATDSTATTDQRGFPRDASPDIGATEAPDWANLGSGDYAILWPNDLDGDGNPYGIEVAIGTDPFTPFGNAGFENLSVPEILVTGEARLRFGNNTAPPAGTTLRLMRSTTLAEGSFVELGRIVNGSAPIDIEGGNVFFLSGENDLVTFSDANPPATKAFYRLQSEYAPQSP